MRLLLLLAPLMLAPAARLKAQELVNADANGDVQIEVVDKSNKVNPAKSACRLPKSHQFAYHTAKAAPALPAHISIVCTIKEAKEKARSGIMVMNLQPNGKKPAAVYKDSAGGEWRAQAEVTKESSANLYRHLVTLRPGFDAYTIIALGSTEGYDLSLMKAVSKEEADAAERAQARAALSEHETQTKKGLLEKLTDLLP